MRGRHGPKLKAVIYGCVKQTCLWANHRQAAAQRVYGQDWYTRFPHGRTDGEAGPGRDLDRPNGRRQIRGGVSRRCASQVGYCEREEGYPGVDARSSGTGTMAEDDGRIPCALRSQPRRKRCVGGRSGGTGGGNRGL